MERCGGESRETSFSSGASLQRLVDVWERLWRHRQVTEWDGVWAWSH